MPVPGSNSPDIPAKDSPKKQPAIPPDNTEAQAPGDEVQLPLPENSTGNINGIEQPGEHTKILADRSSSPVTHDQTTIDSTLGSANRGLVPASLSQPQRPSDPSIQPAEAVLSTPSESQIPDVIKDISDKEKEKEKEKRGDKLEHGSLSTTLTANQPQRRTSHRNRNKSSSSDATPSSNGNGKPKVPSVTRSPKPSFLSKLVRKLVPCVAPSSRTHAIELDETASRTSPEPALTPKEKTQGPEQVVLEPEPPAAPPKGALAATASSTSEQSNLGEGAASALITSLPLTVPPPIPHDPEVILPPTPTTHLLPESETEGVTSGAVQPPGSTGGSSVIVEHRDKRRDSAVPTNGGGDGDDSEGTSFTEDEDMDDGNNADEVEDEEDRLILNGGAGIPIGPDGVPKPLLPPIAPQHAGRKCLVLDLDETLVHSSFKSIQQADYVVPVEIEYHWHNVYVIKRPGVDNFLKKMGEIYEVVVFTASLSKYADPVLDKLDIHQVVTHRLFRESCYNHKGNYVKDLSQLGRPIADTIILDNSPASYIFHPNNAVPVSSWFNDPHDTELTDLVPFLADLSAVDDVRGVLDGAR